jgi:hypothetical protein
MPEGDNAYRARGEMAFDELLDREGRREPMGLFHHFNSRGFAATFELAQGPPAHATVLSIDEKTAIQALDRRTLCCRCRPNGLSTTAIGTLSLYAAFNTKTGEVLAKPRRATASADFVAFLADIVVNRPTTQEIHVIANNLSAHPLTRTGIVENRLPKRP